MSQHFYIGIMSGTSLDGADVVVVLFEDKIKIVAKSTIAYPEDIYTRLKENNKSVREVAELNAILGSFFAECVNIVLQQNSINNNEIVAIGLHGQTIDHQPDARVPYTSQIGDANIVAYQTGITTVADFRSKDIAAGGQGAPLVPAFHHSLLTDKQKNRVIVNIGGIANITLLPQQGDTLGFDTGPGNGLLDGWIHQQQDKRYDHQGEWAASGFIDEDLLNAMLAEPYFLQTYPKSTGREFFNLEWLSQFNLTKVKPVNVQTTLSELTAQTIAESIKKLSKVDEVLACGGGIKNIDLMARIQKNLAGIRLGTTNDYGVDADMLEAMAFAWLAKQTLAQKPGNIPSVTGAKKAVVLGAVYSPY